MADNLGYTEGSGAVIASDEVTIGATPVQAQRIKIILGEDGTYQKDLSAGVFDKAGSISVALASDENVAKETGGNLAAIAAIDFATETTLAAVLTELGQKTEPADTQIISGAVTVSSSALPTGAATLAEQQTQSASLSVLDDWDETDRAKVNIIAGQVGVQGGSGTVSANTQRTVLATDVALPAGTNAIGKLAANSGVDIGDVDVTSQPARSATVDAITAKIATDSIQDGLTALTPKFAIIDAAASGDNTLLAAVSSKKIRILSLMIVAAGTVNVRFESGAGGTALTGQMNLIANTGFVLPFNPCGWFETAATTLLNMELSAAISVDGCLQYVEV